MRVIAGEYKGRRLLSPKGEDVQPTSDRVKEAIFSIVQPELEGAVCLDLFSGTGALGIEALSRGASRVYFCDISRASLDTLRKNLDACRIPGARAVVLKTDWHSAAANINEKCNLVFIDAPFAMCEYYSQILETLARQDALMPGALIVIERDAKSGVYEAPAGFERIKEKQYGGVGVDLLIWANAEGEL